MPLLPPVSSSMNFEPVASADGINENPEPRPVPAVPLSETFKAGWQRDNDIYNTMKWLDRQTNYGEPDQDFISSMYRDHVYGTDLEIYGDRFTGVRNQKEFDALAAQIREERRTTSILEASNPAAAFLASGVASIISPTTLIPVYGVARSVKVGATALKTALAAGASNAAAAAIQEGILHGTQATRTQGETAMAIGGSFLLANILGGAAGGLSAAKFKKLSTALEDLQVSANIDKDFARQAYELKMGQEARSAGAAAIERPDAELKGALGLEKTVSQTGPWGRTMNSPVPSVREAEVKNVEAPGSLTRNREGYSTAPIGGSIETRIKTQGVAPLGQALQELQRIYLDYRFGDPNTKLPGFKNLTSPDKTKMSDREFYQLVGSVASRMDKHENPFVAKAAEVFREKLIEPVAANAVRERLLNPELVRKGRPAKAATVADQKKKLEEWAGPKATPAQRKPVDDLLTQMEEFSGVKFDKGVRDATVDFVANNPDIMDRLRRAFYGNEDVPLALRDVRGQHIRRVVDDLEDGYPYVQDRAVVDRVEAIAKDVRLSLPEAVRDIPINVMVGVQPKAGDMVEISFRGIDGGFRTVDMTLAEFGAARAFSIDGGVFLTRTDLVGDVNKMVGGEVRHELVHALFSTERITALLGRSLFDHAESLGVLDMPLRDYLQKVGDDAWERASTEPVRDVYTKQYSKMSDDAQAEALAQEAIAHMVELRHHGALTDEQLAPILDDLDNLFGKPVPVGEAQKRIVGEWIADLGYAVKAEADGSIKFALRGSDIDVGRSMRADLDRLGYFSGALEAAKRLRQNKGTPEQMLAMLQKEGAKKAEIEATGLDKFILGRETDAGAAGDGGPSAGMVRLYRAEVDPAKRIDIPEWIKQGQDEAGITEAQGRWFVQDKKLLDFYLDDIGRDNARIVSIDVPASDIEKYRVANNAETIGSGRSVKSYSRDPQNEFFLPKDVAARAASAEGRTAGQRAANVSRNQITKSEIIKFLEDNRVDVREVERGLTQEQLAAEARMNELRDQMQAIQRGDYQRTGGFRDEKALAADNPEYAALVAEYDALSARNFGPDRKANEPTKWSAYSLDPNNPTYRETVLHLPVKETSLEAERAALKDKPLGEVLPDGRTVDDALQDIERRRQKGRDATFQSGHFSEPNIIGHMMTSMVKHEGKATYLIDQIQSDWGQKLRDGGVRDEAKIAELKTRRLQLERAAKIKLREDVRPKIAEIEQEIAKRGLPVSQTIIPKGQANDTSSPILQMNYIKTWLANNTDNDLAVRVSAIKEGVEREVADLRLVEAELRTAEAATPGHPLVNTTDQWTNTTLRRAIRQAVEADAEYIAIPHGDTVLSYNPGDTDGMRGFYGSRNSDGIVPKNLRKLLQKIDRDSPAPQKVEKLETSIGLQGWKDDQGPGAAVPPANGADPNQTGFTLFPLTDKVKQTVKEQGQPLFAMRGLDMSPEARKARAEEWRHPEGQTEAGRKYSGLQWYHGANRADRIADSGKFDPKRATSGPMAFFSDSPELASGYAKGKQDTSMPDMDHIGQYFTVDPKDMGRTRERARYTVEQTWHALTQEQKTTILSRVKRIGFQNIDQADGPIVLHPEGTEAINGGHFDYLMAREERGNPLGALRNYWVDSGNIFGNEEELVKIYRLAGYPYPVSTKTAPWYEAPGVLPVYLQLRNPLVTSDEAAIARVVDELEQAFRKDRTRRKAYGADGWDKNTRWTPKEWVAQLKEDVSKGVNGYVWTSIPDKVTVELKRLGYDGIVDTGGKGGGATHNVAIPFSPQQVRSVNAMFDPAKADSPNLMFALRDLSRRLDAPLVDDLGKTDPHPGRVMAVHGTKAQPFDQFDPAKSADFGIHFGTKDQADIPAGYTTTRENARMIPVVLDLKTVVDVPDMMTWPPVEVAAAVEKAYPLARGLEDRVRAVIAAGSTETGPTGSVRPTREALDAGKAELRRLMSEAKIDGLRYWNDSEGEGWSYIVWDEGKVSSATSGEPMMGVKPDGQPQFALRGNGEDILKKVRELGGIKDETGDLANMGAAERKGIINNETGLSPDAMRAHMVEQGYLDDVPYEDVTQSSVNDLYDMISEALSDQGGRGRAYREEMAYQAIRAVQQIIDENGLEIKLTPEQEDALVKMILDRRMSPDDALKRMQMAGAEDAQRVGASNADPLRYTNTRREMEALKEAVEAQYKMGHDPLEGQYFNDEIGDEVWGGTPGQSYIMRLYNHEKIIRRRTQFRSILTDYFQQSQQRAASALRRMERDIADAEARSLQSGREYKMSQTAEKDLSDLRAFVDRTKEELENIADGVIDNILGRPDLLTFDLPKTLRGALKSRTLRIPDAFESASGKFEDFLDRDVRAIGRAYVHSVVVDTEIMRMHGSLTMEEWPIYKKMVDEYHALVNNPELDKLPPAKAEKIKARLEKDWKRATRDLQAQIDRMRGVYKLPEDPTNWGPRTLMVIKQLNLLRMLGGMTVSALPDLARVVMVHGFTDTMRYGIRPLFGHLRAVKLAGDEVQLSGTALDMVLGSRIQAIADVLDNYGRYSKGERGLGWAAEKFGYVTLMNLWNSGIKQWVGAITMTKIIKACKRVADGTATKADIDKLAASSVIDAQKDPLTGKPIIDAFTARRIVEQFEKHGMVEGGLHIPNTEAWDVNDPKIGPSVRKARDALRGAIVRDVDNIIVTPGQEKPLWFSTQMGSVILQFKAFAASSMEKTLIAGLQQRDAGVFMGAAFMVAFGAAVEWLKALTNDKPLPASDAQWVAAAIDRSGLLGWFSDVNNITEKMTRGTIGVSALTGKELSRFASRNVIDALAGPTFGTIGDMTVASGGLFSSLLGGQQVRQSDLAAIRRLIPMQNLFYLSNIFQQLEKSAGKSLGAKQGKSRSPLMDRLSSNEHGPGWLDEFVRAA